jgi:4-hydroxybutyryl-CoA dehydratase/vinylacetyl-CoA-Delta-isomerase
MQDAAGGLVATMASEEDYRNPGTGKYMEKYYKGRNGVPTEDRMRAIKLVEDLTASEFSGWYHAMAITGGGPPLYHKKIVMEHYDLERSKRKAMSAAGIKH